MDPIFIQNAKLISLLIGLLQFFFIFLGSGVDQGFKPPQ